eukprot:CAMPEP_0115850046 /NCGR_PEP_ID=MMETSP0287-20121206/11763_1 /TAXON_ID=412157 /ORGANISM="Chrysochromulina rotalis, Strain UIO044" /LENGTH=174 /DNA_ID=CAMNT_0003304033 /DNA_START=103 /DNA_END=627 /DNA_ORIENTATION=+
MSVVKFKVLCKHVVQQASGGEVDEQKFAKLVSDGKLESHEAKGIVASLHFILTSSARYDVPDETLEGELQQLGLPKEHMEALVGVFRDGRTRLQDHLSQTSLQLPKLDSLRWRVSEDPGTTRAHAVDMQLTLRAQSVLDAREPPPERMLELRLSADTVSLLQAELARARDLCPA